MRKLLDPVLEDASPFSAYFVAIMFTAWYGGLGPVPGGAGLRRPAGGLLFVEPRGSLLIHDLEHQVSLGLYIFVGVVVALLSESLHASRRRTEAARAELADANRGLRKGNRRTPTGRTMADRKRAAVPRLFRAGTGRHGDAVRARGLARSQPAILPLAGLFGRGTGQQDLDRIDPSRRPGGRGRAFPADAPRPRQRLRHG